MNLDPYPLEPDEYVPPPPPKQVAAGFVCRRCGYDLLGLSERGHCPECAAPVIRSLRGNLLELADPGYLRRLGFGALMVELGVVAICAVPIGGIAVYVLAFAVPAIERFYQYLPQIAGLFVAAAGGLGLLGWFVLTGPDPAHLGRDESDRSRLVTRIATLFCFGCWAFMAVIGFVPSLAAVAPGRFALLLWLAGIALAVAVCVQLVASLRYPRHLAARVPDLGLVADLRLAQNTALWNAVAIGLTIACGSFKPLACGAVLGGFFIVVLTLLFFVRYADVLDRTRRHLTRMGETVSAPPV